MDAKKYRELYALFGDISNAVWWSDKEIELAWKSTQSAVLLEKKR